MTASRLYVYHNCLASSLAR
uniref:Uncharacterized protein n=1 Tax=Anguilla anguilla TaxID=7936 RepID=A0A0E9WF01_ANGAN